MARPFARRISSTWWLGRLPYRVFLLRELSAVFLALYVIVLLLLVRSAREGPAELADYVDFLGNPWMLAFHAVALGFALLHTFTWFQAVPKGIRLRWGDKQLPPSLLIGSLYVGLAAVSAIVAATFLV